MADADPVQNLCEEATCSVCLEYFQEPVTVECGHVFCRACIARCWENLDEDAACPQCREPVLPGNVRPARHLASIVDIAKRLSLQVAREEAALGWVCEAHREPLKLFCRDDQTPVCVVCDKSGEHKSHDVILKDEAFEEYQGKIQDHLTFLKQESQRVRHSEIFGTTESQNLLQQTEAQRQKIVAGFEQLREFLEEQERLLLAQLKALDDEVHDHKEKYHANLMEKLSSFDNLIEEMEKKQEQPMDEFLQDLRNILQRCRKEKFVRPEVFPIDLKERIRKCSGMHPFLSATTKTFKDTLISGPPQQKPPKQKPPKQKVAGSFPLYGYSHYDYFEDDY